MDRPLRARLKPREFHILLALAKDPKHGYGIRAEVEERTENTVKLWPGMLYGALKDLVERGLIDEALPPADTPDDDRERKYYSLTDLGRVAARAEAERLETYLSLARSSGVL